MAQSQQLLQVALIHVPLFPEDAQFGGDALQAISGVTGIAPELLARVRQRMRETGSLEPLRSVLTNTAVHKAEGFNYMLTVAMQQTRGAQPAAQVGQTVTLEVQSRRGRVTLILTTRFDRAAGRSQERQTARVFVNCTVETPSSFRSFRHKMVLVHHVPLAGRAWASAA